MDSLADASTLSAAAEIAYRAAKKDEWVANEAELCAAIEAAGAAGEFRVTTQKAVSPECIDALRGKGYRTSDCCIGQRDGGRVVVAWGAK